MRHFYIFGSLLFLAAPASAALDPETKVPYQLRVVLRVSDHPNFTDHFRRELKRELHGQLQAALGALGTAEVIDMLAAKKETWPPLWKLVEEKGLEALDGLNEPASAAGVKTHFVRLDFLDDSYDLQTRQHDGTSGFVTPLVRKAQTHDRGNVARLAGLMIGKDFGLIATLDPPGPDGRVFLKVKAGALGALTPWVKRGEVFAVMEIRSERRRLPAETNTKGPARLVTQQTGKRIDGMLVQAIGEPRDGVIPGQVFYRFRYVIKLKKGQDSTYEDPFPTGMAGFRCVKLGTTTGPLRLQLLDKAGAPQKGVALQVYARATDYPDDEKESEQTINRDGVFVSNQSFAHVAFVRVMVGNRNITRIPVELLDDRVEARHVWLDPTAELRDRLDTERRGLALRLTDGRLIQVRCFQEITALEQAGKKADALERGQSALKLLDESAEELQDEVDKLQARAREVLKTDRFAGDCEQQLQALRGKQLELRGHLDALKASIIADNDPTLLAKQNKVTDLIRSAELLADQAEYDKALGKYQEALAAVAGEPAARQRIEVPYQSLKKAWQVKPGDAAHAQARKFIVDTWPKLAALKDVRDQLPVARQAFDRCKAVGDRLAVKKMHLAGIEIASRSSDDLKNFTEAAKASKEEEEFKTLETFTKVNEDLHKLLKDVHDYLLAGQKK